MKWFRIMLAIFLLVGMLLGATVAYAAVEEDDPGPEMPLEDPPPGWQQFQKLSTLIWQLRLERLEALLLLN